MSSEQHITWAEVKNHNKADDLWCVINGKVYDLSKFRHEHPGGSDVLEDIAGKDATREFIEVGHSKDAEKQMTSYQVGIIAPDENETTVNSKLIISVVGALLAGIATAFILKRLFVHFK